MGRGYSNPVERLASNERKDTSFIVARPRRKEGEKIGEFLNELIHVLV